MTGRLPTGLLLTALLRRVNDAGGFGAVLAKGDAGGGAILIVVPDRQGGVRLYERGLDRQGRTRLTDSTPPDDPEGYWRRRRDRDPDLWVVELDIADAERLVAETILDD